MTDNRLKRTLTMTPALSYGIVNAAIQTGLRPQVWISMMLDRALANDFTPANDPGHGNQKLTLEETEDRRIALRGKRNANKWMRGVLMAALQGGITVEQQLAALEA